MKFIVATLAALLIAVPALADNDVECNVVTATIDPTEAGATDDFINLVDGTFGTTEASDDEYLVPQPLKAWGLFVEVDVAPTVDDEWTIILRDDAADSVVSCVITGAAATTCGSGEFTVAEIAQGSRLAVQIDSSTGTADPAAAAEISVSFCLDR